MILNLEKQIEALEVGEDVKQILRQIISGLNTADEARRVSRTDLVFKNSEKGPVYIGTDGNHYRTVVEVSGATVSHGFINLGKKMPKED